MDSRVTAKAKVASRVAMANSLHKAATNKVATVVIASEINSVIIGETFDMRLDLGPVAVHLR